MKNLLLSSLLLLSSSAFAIGLGNDNPPSLGGNSTQTNLQAVGVDVSNRITNDTRSAATSFAAGGTAVSGGGQGGIGYSASGGSTSNVDFNITSPKNTPAVFSGNVYPTTSCAHSSTVGGSGVGFGLALGTSWTDEECSLRETARSFQLLGKTEDAVHVLCVSKFASAAPTCKAIVPSQSAPRPEQQ